VVEDVTALLTQALDGYCDIRDAFEIIAGCKLIGRETKSAALGEISEHLIARLVGGRRCE
jgi:hypothetical protein